MANYLVDNKKVQDGIITTPGYNTQSYYTRETPTSFSVNGASNGTENIFDWVLVATLDSRYAKANVIKIASTTKKSQVVQFATAFPSTNYFVFFSSAGNTGLYTVEKYNNRFVINSTGPLDSEITWFAIHQTLIDSTGFNSSGNLFAGTRVIGNPLPDNYDGSGNVIDSIPIENNAYCNLSGWYNNEYLIQPTNALDGIQVLPNLISYSTILSSNAPINTFWIEKAPDRVRIGCSYPTPCSVDYLMVATGIDWWDLLTN